MGKSMQQTTITRPVSKEGLGLHTGEPCAVTLKPADADAGLVFRVGSQAIPAIAEFVVDTQRGTTLGAHGVAVGCIEHLMAACYGLRLDNVTVEVSGPELPAADGSAREWVQLLRAAGVQTLQMPARVARISTPVWVEDGPSFAVVLPGGAGLSLAVEVDFTPTVAGRQRCWMRLTPGRFARDLAPARTFALEGELKRLRALGFARGGSLENAFVVGPDSYSGPLRYEDEVVRHKALDLVGDLALCGLRLAGTVVAVRPSHRLNVLLARVLRDRLVHSMSALR